MDVAHRTAGALELRPDVEAFDLTVSTADVAATTDVVASLRQVVAGLPPGAEVGVAAFAALDRVEPFAFYVAALTAVVPDLASSALRTTAFQLADPTVLGRSLARIGLGDARVRTITRILRFESARDLLRAVAQADPVGAQRIQALTAPQVDDLRRVLDGMLRERSNGTRRADLSAAIHVGSGRVGTRTPP